jgi:hypothetical protein
VVALGAGVAVAVSAAGLKSSAGRKQEGGKVGSRSRQRNRLGDVVFTVMLKSRSERTANNRKKEAA